LFSSSAALPGQNQIGTTERIRLGSFISRKQALLIGEKLGLGGYDLHIERISDIYDSFNSAGGDEQLPFRDGFAKIQYQKKQFWGSRIIYVDRGGNFEVLIPPMNSFNDR